MLRLGKRFLGLTLESKLFAEADMIHEVLLLLLGTGWELIRLQLFDCLAQHLRADWLWLLCLGILIDALFLLLCTSHRSSARSRVAPAE